MVLFALAILVKLQVVMDRQTYNRRTYQAMIASGGKKPVEFQHFRIFKMTSLINYTILLLYNCNKETGKYRLRSVYMKLHKILNLVKISFLPDSVNVMTNQCEI